MFPRSILWEPYYASIVYLRGIILWFYGLHWGAILYRGMYGVGGSVGFAAGFCKELIEIDTALVAQDAQEGTGDQRNT